MFMFAALSVLLAACEEDPQVTNPNVSFETKVPVISEGVATLTLKVENYKGTEPVTVPVTFSGTAEKGTDYTVSAEEFVYGGDTPVTTITVTQLSFNAEKTIKASLDVPEGFVAGKYQSTSFNLQGEVAYSSFIGQNLELASTLPVAIGIVTLEGNAYKLQYPGEVTVSVNTEKSTAVEGTNFEFPNGKTVTIAPEKSEGILTINALEYNAEKNKIVLNIEPSEKFGVGMNAEISITMIDPYDFLNGEWVISELVTTAESMATAWYIEADSYEAQLGKYPEFNAADKFSFNGETGVFTPNFVSGFKNYFSDETNVTVGDIFYEGGISSRTPLQTYKFATANRNFSAENPSKEECIVGMIMNQEDDTVTLYIIDWVPTDFLTILTGYYCIYPDNHPSAVQEPGSDTLMSSSYLIVKFKKVQAN